MAQIIFEATLTTDKLTAQAAEAKKTVKEMIRDIEKSGDSLDKVIDRLSADIAKQKEIIASLNKELKDTYEAFKKASAAGDSTAGDLANKLSTLRDQRDMAVESLNDSVEAQKELIEGNVKEAESVQTLSQGIGDMVVKAGGATTIMYALLSAFKDTTVGLDAFNIVGAVTKQILNDIVTGAGLSVSRMRETVQIQKELNSLRKEALLTDSSAKDLMTIYNLYYSQAADLTKSNITIIKKSYNY